MKYKKVIITGKFNIIHPGHLRILEFAKNISEKLIVGVLSDKLARDDAFIKDKIRLLNIKSIKLIDEAQKMMGMLGNNNPMFENLLGKARKEMTDANPPTNPTRDRLKKKLEERKNTKK